MMWSYGYGLGSWIPVIAVGFFASLVLVGLGLFIAWLVMGAAEASEERRPEWCEIADRRYASGELSREQYEEICGTIRGR